MTADDPLRETELEMALRHVIEAEMRIARQRVLVERLAPAGGRAAELSVALLADFQTTLAAHRAYLARLMPKPQG